MSTSIRIATTNDVEYITELSCQLGYETTREKTQQRLAEILNHTDNCVFVAVNDAKVIGWIHGFYSLRVEAENFVEIGGLVVDKNYRKKGIGKLLIETVYEWSRLKECRNIRVRSNTIRKEAHQFYKKLGFTETKEQKVFGKQLG